MCYHNPRAWDVNLILSAEHLLRLTFGGSWESPYWVAFGFLSQSFGRWWGPTNSTLSFCKCIFSGGDTMRWWGHSNPTLCKRICLNFLYSRALGTRLSHLCGFLAAFRSILTSRMTSRFERLVACLLFLDQVTVSFSRSVDELQIGHSREETSSFQKSNISPTHFLPKTITFKAKLNFISKRCLLFCCFYTDRVALNTLPINKLASPQKLILYKEISKW